MPSPVTPRLSLTFCVDEHALSEVHARSFPQGWTPQDFCSLFAIVGTFAVMAWIDDLPVGMLMVRVVEDESEIITLCVDKRQRRIGIAQAMLERGMQEAARMGARAMYLEVAAGNEAARTLYEGLDFVETGRREGYYADGEDALLMMCALDAP